MAPSLCVLIPFSSRILADAGYCTSDFPSYGCNLRFNVFNMFLNLNKKINPSRTFVQNMLDKEHLFCYIIEKNKCFERGEDLMTKTYRVVNRFRFTVFVVLTIVILTTAVNFAFGFNTAASLTKTDYMDVQIVSGDTLWSIAQNYMPSDMDTRKAVYELCQVNDISASELYAGMTIQVPIYH